MNRFLIAAAAMLTATAAQAADIAARPPTKAPPLSPATNWTGFYAGVNAGYGWQDTDVSYTQNDLLFFGLYGPGGSGGPLMPPASLNKSGAVGGGQIGYNWQFNPQWLLGFEADISGSGIKGSAFYPTNGASPADLSVDQKLEWFGTVRARLGWLPTDRLLVYGTGGFAYGSVKDSVTFTGAPVVISAGGYGIACLAGQACMAGSSSAVRTGWTAGAGLEYALSQNLTARAEYLHVDLGGDSFRVSSIRYAGGTVPSSFNAHFGNAAFDIVRAGVNYRF